MFAIDGFSQYLIKWFNKYLNNWPPYDGVCMNVSL